MEPQAVLTLDPSIDVAQLTHLIHQEWGPCAPPTFVPVGGDSWCFLAEPWWVSVRRDRGGHCAPAYETAAQLPSRGLDFVLAPLRARSGGVVATLGRRPVVVFPALAGAELDPGDASPTQADAVADMVAALHTIGSDDDLGLPRETFELPFIDELETGVASAIDGAADAGPYGTSVTRLVRANRDLLSGLCDEMAVVRRRCTSAGTFVLTHGEPTNVFLRPDGRLLLMDWGALGWAPPERDWLSLTELGIPWPKDTRLHVRRFYELRWVLSEVAEYVARFTAAHEGDIGDDDKWSELLRYLPDAG